jgi:hypothetical protein
VRGMRGQTAEDNIILKAEPQDFEGLMRAKSSYISKHGFLQARSLV